MLRLAQVVLLCLFVRGGTGQFQEVHPSFCPSSGLVGAQCDDLPPPEMPPPPNTLVSQVMHLRCQSGCLMDNMLNFLDDYVVDEEEIWPSFNISPLGLEDREKLDVCQRNCLIYSVFKDLLNQNLTEAQCQAICTTNPQPLACESGCAIGSRIFELQTADDPTKAPVQPINTPAIFFDTQSESPWEFSLNLSSVLPDSSAQLRPNSTGLVINGFVLQITVERDGMNITDNHYMTHPTFSGSVSLGTFLRTHRCQVMYLSFGVVNFYGSTNLTEFTRTCIPGKYSLKDEPRLELGFFLVIQGSLPEPSLGSIVLNWFPPQPFPMFGYPTYEVSASYVKQSPELDEMCQPNGGDEEFRQGNLSGISIFRIVSGPHGNIQLLPPSVGPCMYQVTLAALWMGPNVSIPFLQNFRREYTRDVDIIYTPDAVPIIQITASVTNGSGDGFYRFANTSFARLDPPTQDFYESYNAIKWTISLLTATQEFISTIAAVTEENPFLTTMFNQSNINILVPDRVRDVKLSPIGPMYRYQLNVELARNSSLTRVRRDYLVIPKTVASPRGIIAPPIPPEPLRNVTIEGCSIYEGTGNTSLQVAWQLPVKTYGMLKNCSFNISVLEDILEDILEDNVTAPFVFGVTTERPEDRNRSFTLPFPTNDSDYLFTIEMMCINQHGLSTGVSTSDSFNGSNCVVVEPPTPSPSSSSALMMMPTTSLTASETPTAPTTEPGTPSAFRTEYYIAIGGAVGLFVALLFLVILISFYCICMYKRKQHKTLVWEMKRTRSILRKARVSTSLIDEWEMDPNHLYMKEKLGEGNFGEVYQATIADEVDCIKAKKYVEEMAKVSKTPNACAVAVKLLKANAPGEAKQSFLNEINMMKKVAHGNSYNVVRMVGCVSIQSPYALVLEYVPYGSLLDYLRENRKLAQRRRQLKRMMHLAKETSRKKTFQQQIGGGQSAAFGGPLPCIEEASLHSMDNVSGQYLSHSELNPAGGSSGDSYFSQSAPADPPRSPALLCSEGGRDRAQGNDYLGVVQFNDDEESRTPLFEGKHEGAQGYDYLGVGQLEESRASPYEEPLRLGFLPDASDLGHNRPASYIQPISSPTQVLFTAGSQKSDDSEPMVPTAAESDSSKKSTTSSAMNPLYVDPEIRNPYPDLGELEAVNLMMFAYQISSGMEYLASLGIVHRDLACRNVLVDRDKVLKISDFGLSRETDLYVSSSQGRLPLRWMSPEAILDRVFTEKSDVWAYGITIWEICTLGGYPYATTPNSELLQSLLEGYRMEKPDNCSDQIYRKMLDCWHIEPEERPLFKQLRSDLDQLLMVHQPDEYIKFSDIDEDKLPYYKRGTSNSENSGGSTDEDALNVSKVLNSYTATCTMRSTGAASNETTERVVPAEVVRVGNGNIPIVIPISPQSSDGTIRGDDETQKNHHDDDLNAEQSETALTAQGSASTIRDDSGNEETKL